MRERPSASGLSHGGLGLGWITRVGGSAAGVRPVAASPIMAIKATSNAVWISVLGVMLPFPIVKSWLMKRI
jgi:hypothetical protein